MAPCSLASRVIPRITDSVNEWVRRAVCIEAEVTRERPRLNSPGPSHACATYALENEPEVLAGDDLARGQHDREPPLGAACGSRRGGLDIEIPLLRADRVAAGRKTRESIVPVGVRLNRRNGRAGEHDEPSPDTDLSRITEAITVGVIEQCPADLATRERGRRRVPDAVLIVLIVLAAGVPMSRALLVPPVLPNLEGPGRPVLRGAACSVVALLVVVVLIAVVSIVPIAVSPVRTPKGVAVRRCRAGGPGAILGNARAYRRGDQG